MCSSSSIGASSLFDAKKAQVNLQIGIAVERKSLDVMKDQGEAAVSLIDAAADIARELGKGNAVDALA